MSMEQVQDRISSVLIDIDRVVVHMLLEMLLLICGIEKMNKRIDSRYPGSPADTEDRFRVQEPSLNISVEEE